MKQLPRIDALVKMLGEDPGDLFLNYAAGLEYAAEQKLPEAENYFKTVIRIDASYIAAYYQLGKLFELKQNIPEALHHYRTGLEKARLKKDHKAINELGEAIFLLEE